ncbi:olfactory receptor 7A10-like [Ochotona curzoniae]|uniref:olfactory receptor 7A10-like n=1 Tax=Ochotona curzoniae TaxID=130825 RepID=UPI001B3480FA|nr:olfactory receptor 7A10-like [Ochotona curzoniae]
MYFFLANLSLLEVCFTSTTVPKMLVNIQMQSQAISYAGCITQMLFSITFGALDDFLLAVMAYDRFVAICQPLHHTVIMNPWLCVQLVLMSWTIGVVNALMQSLLVLRLRFCTHFEIPHFFCDLHQVVHIACPDTFVNVLTRRFATALLVGVPPSGILDCYSFGSFTSSIGSILSKLGKAFPPVPSLCHLAILWHKHRCVPQCQRCPKISLNCSSLGDVHSGHPHAEPLHLQPEQQS